MKDLLTDARSTFVDDEDEEYETPLKVLSQHKYPC